MNARFLRCSILIATGISLICSSASVFSAADHTHFKAALELLESAKDVVTTPRSLDLARKRDPILLLQLARDNVDKAPAIYLGRKGTALEQIDLAIAEIRTGDRAKKAKDCIVKAAAVLRDGMKAIK